MSLHAPLPLSLVIPALALSLAGCKHEPDTTPLDAELYQLALNSSGHVWYKNSDELLPRSTGSGHSEAFLRTRYNAIAATALDTLYRVVADTAFPPGSLIVKELWSDASTIGTYAILLKRPDAEAADADGWVWGYLRANGEVRAPAIDRGAACRTCHMQDGEIDATLMNQYFPE